MSSSATQRDATATRDRGASIADSGMTPRGLRGAAVRGANVRAERMASSRARAGQQRSVDVGPGAHLPAGARAPAFVELRGDFRRLQAPRGAFLGAPATAKRQREERDSMSERRPPRARRSAPGRLHARRPRRRARVAARATRSPRRSTRPRPTGSANSEEVRAYQEGRLARDEYGRYGNPTWRAVERKLAELEGGERRGALRVRHVRRHHAPSWRCCRRAPPGRDERLLPAHAPVHPPVPDEARRRDDGDRAGEHAEARRGAARPRRSSSSPSRRPTRTCA